MSGSSLEPQSPREGDFTSTMRHDAGDADEAKQSMREPVATFRSQDYARPLGLQSSPKQELALQEEARCLLGFEL